MPSAPDNLKLILSRIHQAEERAGHASPSVKLIAVSKFQPQEAVRELLEAGHRVFGENRVQEAKAKFTALRANYPEIELHLIGPLQTNKAEEAVRLFDVIQTIDRPNLAEAIAKAIKKAGCTPRLYIEVNIGNEPQKAGVAPDKLDEFLDFCQGTCGLTMSGLMCIPPHNIDPEPYFKIMLALAKKHGLPHLSMGMSADFEAAIRHGATEVRVGTALFGERAEAIVNPGSR